MTVLLQSLPTCPVCAATKVETMPTDACQYFYECTSCKTLLKPRMGDCCVCCSYGSCLALPFSGATTPIAAAAATP